MRTRALRRDALGLACSSPETAPLLPPALRDWNGHSPHAGIHSQAMISERLVQDAAGLFERARAHAYRLVTAESCTGGLIAASLTAVPGASLVLERGFVTYSNEAKVEMLGVPAELIQR